MLWLLREASSLRPSPRLALNHHSLVTHILDDAHLLQVLREAGLRPRVSALALAYRSEIYPVLHMEGLPQVPGCDCSSLLSRSPLEPRGNNHFFPQGNAQAQGAALRTKSFFPTPTPTSYRIHPLCIPRPRKGHYRDSPSF